MIVWKIRYDSLSWQKLTDMNESQTRIDKIDPKLFAAGWNKVAESHILTEQSAYLIAPGRVQKVKTGKAKKADYVLEYRGRKLLTSSLSLAIP